MDRETALASARRPLTREAEQAAAAPPPALRERFIVVDDFLPAELAGAMRADIEAHFADPQRHRPETHQVWNYWFVPELYAYLRTQPEKVIERGRAERFFEALRSWSTTTLGLAGVTWPYLSLYVPGCRQSLHNDSVNGRFGYVYSLTRNERRTTGGEIIVHREGDPFRTNLANPGAGRSFYDLIEPRFNRLVVFDDRMPHAVERLEGPMDPLEGRFVLHGHISETGAIVFGALGAEAAAAATRETLQAFVAGAFLDGYHGPVTLSLQIAPDGQVTSCGLLLDRVMHADGADRRWPGLVRDLMGRLEATRFPPASGPSRLIVPVLFGPRIAPG